MQAVDRNDWLRQKFALADRHQFKKYYMKMILALMDMSIVNASIHYFLANPQKREKPNHRYAFMNELADQMLQTDWENFEEVANADALTNLRDSPSSNKRQIASANRIDKHVFFTARLRNLPTSCEECVHEDEQQESIV
jgi:hypothetical protein